MGKIADLDLEDARGAQIRSRARWVEEGESSSAFFLHLEKKHGAESWIPAIRDAHGNVLCDIDGICSTWRDFYSSLFTAGPTDPDVASLLLDGITSQVPSDQVPLCEGLLSPAEVLTALRGMAHNKAPGSDGLPAEVYLKFWDVLSADLVSVLNHSYSAGHLSDSQRHGLITLLYKKGDRLDCKNWRPITLLNVDYKLCARTLAGRLLKVLHHVVAPDQTCGVPGRFIGENVALLRDVVSFANETDLPVAILSLDQEKAFDRVDWPFLLATLRMGFGPSFICWVNLLYSDISSSVIVNKYCSDPFFPSRGVHQGCPLSPLLCA